jgi:hypothetical protein
LNDAVERILDRLEGVKSSGSGWSALCPAHDDSAPSLSLGEGDEGGAVIKCHAGCETEDVVKAMGLQMSDLAGKPRVVAEYPYTDEAGNVLYTIQRWQPKDFRTVPAKVAVADRTLYARQWIEWARETGNTIYVVEGEKDANSLIERGIPATCNPHGAGKWLPHYSDLLKGCDVVVVADNDDKGLMHARDVYKHIEPVAESVKVAKPSYGKDVSELLAAGYGIANLQPIPERPGLQAFRADQIIPKAVTWAWPHYVPFGAMTLIDGDPAAGKSTLTIDLVAKWSTGMDMPDGGPSGGPFDCVMISAEDDPDYTLAPRLRGAGARLDRVHLVTGGMREDSAFNLGVDLTALEQMIVETGARIVTMDPLAAFLPGGMDARMDTEVRSALQPIIGMARRLSVALVVVRHLTKSQTKAMYAGGGSVGFIAASRAAFLVSNDPASGDAHKVMAPIKTNLTRMPAGLSYSIESMASDPDIPYIEWHGTAEYDAQTLLDGKSGQEERNARIAAREFLLSVLEAALYPGMTWTQIVAKGREDGYSERTLRRARDAMSETGEVKHEINPKSSTGMSHLGTWWRATTVAADKAVTPEEEKPVTTEPLEGADDPDTALMAKPLVCEVCKDTDALRWGEPWFTVRCKAHNPMTWRA